MDSTYALAASSVLLAIGLYFLLTHRSSVPIPKVPLPDALHEDEESSKKKLHGPNLLVQGGTMIECYDPATGFVLDYVPVHTKQDVDQMVIDARRAQQQWVKTSFEQRRRVLQSLSAFVLNHQQDIAAVASRDSGKTFVDAFFGEILTTLEKIQWTCTHGEAALRPEFRSVGLMTAHKLARVEYIPRGVVAAIVSWNYPFHNAFGPIISALFAGNAIIIKCSEHVAWSTTRYFAPIIHAILERFVQIIIFIIFNFKTIYLCIVLAIQRNWSSL
jgi:aldehyde dehydrogenase (NAD+)